MVPTAGECVRASLYGVGGQGFGGSRGGVISWHRENVSRRLRSSRPCSWRGAPDGGASGFVVPRWALAAARDKTGTNLRSLFTPMIPASETQLRENFDVHASDTGLEDVQGPKINIHDSRATLIV